MKGTDLPEKCGWCYEGEIADRFDVARECPYCEGSGFVIEAAPRWTPDTRAEQRGEK